MVYGADRAACGGGDRRTRARRERINAGIVSEMLTGCGYGRQQSFTPLSLEFAGNNSGNAVKRFTSGAYKQRGRTPKQSAGARDYRTTRARGGCIR